MVTPDNINIKLKLLKLHLYWHTLNSAWLLELYTPSTKPKHFHSVDVFPHNYLAIFTSLVSFKLLIASQIIFEALFIQYEW